MHVTSRLVVQHPCQVSFKFMQGCRRSWEDKLKCVKILSVKDHNSAKICRTWIISPHALLDLLCNITAKFHSNLCKNVGGVENPYENSISIPYGKVTESLRTCWGKIFLEEFLKILKKAITESWCHWGILKFPWLTYSITSLSLIFASASWEISLKTGSKIIRHLHKAWLHSNILVLKQKFGLYIYVYKM